MAKHQTSTLDGTELAAAVAMAAGMPIYCMESNWPGNGAIYGLVREHGAIVIRDLLGDLHIERAIGGTEEWGPHIRWSQGGPFIERERISVVERGTCWAADAACACVTEGPTPLVAAMRALVLAKLGSEVELPDVPT